MNLDTYLRVNGIDGKDFAPRVALTEASLSRIRRGQQNISRDTIRRIVAETGGVVSAQELVFDGVEQATPAAEAPEPAQDAA